jgi:hypothetical protein
MGWYKLRIAELQVGPAAFTTQSHNSSIKVESNESYFVYYLTQSTQNVIMSYTKGDSKFSKPASVQPRGFDAAGLPNFESPLV